jgi:hypothetical protein
MAGTPLHPLPSHWIDKYNVSIYGGGGERGGYCHVKKKIKCICQCVMANVSEYIRSAVRPLMFFRSSVQLL